MLKHVKSNNMQREFIWKLEKKILIFRNILKAHNIIHDNITSKYIFRETAILFSQFGSRSRTRSVCVLTGRTISVYKKTFKATRMALREKSNTGYFVGVRKSSW